MRRFRFSLHTVLKLHERRDREARSLLAQRLGERSRLEVRRQLLDAATQHAEREVAAASAVSPIAGAYLSTLAQRRQDLALELTRNSAQVNEARDGWIRAHRERKSLERLRDLRREAYDQGIRNVEQHELEELASMRAETSRRQGR